MSSVIWDMSMSLDGFVAATDPTYDEPLGRGGERLHQWAFADGDERNRDVLARGLASLGAIVTGRVTYDQSVRWWGPDGPTGQARLPLFVVTHAKPDDVPADSVYTFVTDGVESALAQAKVAAGGSSVSVMGTVVARQLLRSGLIDLVSVHIVPVLFGGGTPLYALAGHHVELEPVEVSEVAGVTHMRLNVKAAEASSSVSTTGADAAA